MEDKYLSGKKILFLAPSFFNYELDIMNEMEKMGAEVHFYDERSIKKSIFKSLLRFCPSIFNVYSRCYFRKIIDKERIVKFDYIFVIKSEMIPESILASFKQIWPTAKICLYLYDSIQHIPNIESKIPYYDKVSTFDRKDVSMNPKLYFRPLFYSDTFKKKSSTNVDILYDLAFCGTIHTDRLAVLKDLEVIANSNSWKFYKFYYLQAEFVFYFYKLFRKEFYGVPKSEFSFVKKSAKELAYVQDRSKVIIDIETPNQAGLTMRTIEMIGLQKKMITTNAEVLNYDFYNPNNICVIERCNPKIPKEFMITKYQPLSNEIYNKYSLKQWIKDVL